MAETTPSDFDEALRRHHAGQFEQAEALYRRVLAAQGDHADALHALGVLRAQLGQPDAAIELIRRALALQPDVEPWKRNLSSIYGKLGGQLLAQDKFAEAAEAYRQAAGLTPDDPEAYYNLGVASGTMARFDDAIGALRRAVELRPNYPSAWNNLGNALAETKRYAEAVEAYRQALDLQPAFAEAHNNLGIALQQLGELDEAIASYRQSLKLRSGRANVFYHLSNALKEKGDIEQAEVEIRSALSLRPDYAEAYITLSALLVDQHRWDEAIAAARQAIAARPTWAGGFNNLGFVLRTRGQHDEALALFQQALALDPHLREALVNVGTAMLDLGRLDEAIESLRHALRQYPDLPEAHLNLGNAFKEAGQIDQAIAAYRDALAIKYNAAADNLLLALNYSPSFTPQQIIEEHLRWGEACAATARSRHAPRAVGNGTRKGADWATARDRVPATASATPHDDPPPERRLRIGYVSPDFRRHVVGYNILPLFERHDHGRFEIFCYSNTAVTDEVTDRFRTACDHFRDVKALSDERIAQLVRDDRIDILVDLALHTSGNRLPVFAHKPAPVQVTFAGYPGTTGLREIDYRLSDAFLDPPSEDGGLGLQDEFYSERTVRLPDSFWCYVPYVDPPGISALPALEIGHVTFGCLNAFCKVNPQVIELWSRVLGAVSSSRMLVLSRPGSHRDRTLQLFQSHGVDRCRIEFLGYQPFEQYLRTYHRIDIGLDTFPYNGHTTAIESLWMGVPVVTLVGKVAAARAGWCQLNNVGLPELAGHDPDQFVRIAMTLAANLPRLAELRAGLRRRMENSPLMDAERFTRNIETAYQEMYRRFTSGK